MFLVFAPPPPLPSTSSSHFSLQHQLLPAPAPHLRSSRPQTLRQGLGEQPSASRPLASSRVSDPPPVGCRDMGERGCPLLSSAPHTLSHSCAAGIAATLDTAAHKCTWQRPTCERWSASTCRPKALNMRRTYEAEGRMRDAPVRYGQQEGEGGAHQAPEGEGGQEGQGGGPAGRVPAARLRSPLLVQDGLHHRRRARSSPGGSGPRRWRCAPSSRRAS